jgi:hypothetical protein
MDGMLESSTSGVEVVLGAMKRRLKIGLTESSGKEKVGSYLGISTSLRNGTATYVE